MRPKSGIDRRELLKIGASTVAVPGFLGACSHGRVGAGPLSMTEAQSPGYFEQNFGVTQESLRGVMAAALSRGGDFADLYFEHSSELEVGYEDGKVARAGTSIALGVGVRVVVGDQTGYAFTEDLSLESMQAAARTAAGIASLAPGRPPADLTPITHPRYYDVDYDWREIGVADVQPLLASQAARAHELEPDLRRVQQRFVAAQKNVMIVDSDGRVSVDSQPLTRMYMTLVIQKGGQTQSNGYNLSAREGMSFYTPERQERLVQVALDRTRILFESGRPPAGELPVVLAAGSSGILLHEAIGHGMEADFNRKGVSIFSDRLNKRVAIDDVTIIDDGTCENTRGAINCDDEGNPSKKTLLVENGILRSYLHDRISAAQYGVEPTGSGRRESFRHVPMPRMRATYMRPGKYSPEEVIGRVKKGIFCDSFTNGQVNIGAGDYSFYVKNGYLIEDGQRTQPIKDVNIIGNGPESLSRVSMVANDYKMDESGWTCGKDGQGVPVSLGMPTVLVDGIVVGGKTS